MREKVIHGEKLKNIKGADELRDVIQPEFMRSEKYGGLLGRLLE